MAPASVTIDGNSATAAPAADVVGIYNFGAAVLDGLNAYKSDVADLLED